MKKFFAYLFLLPYLIRANFLTAYRESLRQKKFVVRKQKPVFFKTQVQSTGEAVEKALKTGTQWYVIEPEQGKFVAVSEKYIQNHKKIKVVFKSQY